MSKLNVFNFTTLNGFYKGPDEDISWSKRDNDEDSEFASGNAMGAGPAARDPAATAHIREGRGTLQKEDLRRGAGQPPRLLAAAVAAA